MVKSRVMIVKENTELVSVDDFVVSRSCIGEGKNAIQVY